MAVRSLIEFRCRFEDRDEKVKVKAWKMLMQVPLKLSAHTRERSPYVADPKYIVREGAVRAGSTDTAFGDNSGAKQRLPFCI